MPFWGQVVLMVVIAGAVVGLAYWMFPNISQTREEIATEESAWNDKQREIRKGQAIEQRLQEFEREVAALERKLSDVAQILPRDTETGDLLQWIKNLGDQSNLDLKSFSPGGLRPVEFYKEFPIEMNVVGNYHDLGIFLDRVSKYSRIINVDKLQMDAEKSDPGKTIQANFTAVTFVYDENTEGGGEEELQ
jgi:type IV pilus assembly protein PilO